MPSEPPQRKENADHDGKISPIKSAVVRIFRAFQSYRVHWKRKRKKKDTDHAINERTMARWTRRVGLFNGLLVLISLVTAKIFYLQYKAMEADQRPWVGLNNLGENPDSSKVVVLLNGGRSPAREVSVSISDKVTFRPETLPNARCVKDCRISDIEMLPNVPLVIRIPKIGMPVPPPDSPFWIVIRIDYKDTENGSHATGICLVKTGPDLSSCDIPNSNYAD